MLTKYLLLALLPIAYARIAVRIKAGKSAAVATVDYNGEDVAIISDPERRAFQLTDDKVKDASKVFSGARCTDVFFKRPTPWEDVYHKFGWDQVQRTLRPVRARVLAVKSKPEAVATAEYVNDHPTITAKYSTSVTQSVEESTTHTWSIGGELTVGQEIEYSVSVGAGNVGGKTSMSYAANWGNDTMKGNTITLGATSNVEVNVPPGKGVLATLTATRGTMEIEIDYEATVRGDVFCNYHRGYKNHHWWAYPVQVLQRFGHLPETVKSTEKISIGFYTSARIVISDLKRKTYLQDVPAGIINVGRMHDRA
ncbi:U-megalopygitoxin(8)-Mc8-like [Anticarsia gemmatalis]|uniref:U-megalopygitoxin(8)-Mc8-like n=1 Tax=Anticarsia gemmatalis TaxID=129554 RepID=UPI003F75AAF9